jgi:hypothetical protein
VLGIKALVDFPELGRELLGLFVLSLRRNGTEARHQAQHHDGLAGSVSNG